MTEYAYSHRPDGDYQGSYPTAKHAAAAGAVAVEDFLAESKERMYYVAAMEVKPLSAFAPEPNQLVGDIIERISIGAGDNGDEMVSWLDEHVGSTTSQTAEAAQVAADLGANLSGVVDWWADKHKAPVLRVMVGEPMVVYLHNNQEWSFRDTDNG